MKFFIWNSSNCSFCTNIFSKVPFDFWSGSHCSLWSHVHCPANFCFSSTTLYFYYSVLYIYMIFIPGPPNNPKHGFCSQQFQESIGCFLGSPSLHPLLSLFPSPLSSTIRQCTSLAVVLPSPSATFPRLLLLQCQPPLLDHRASPIKPLGNFDNANLAMPVSRNRELDVCFNSFVDGVFLKWCADDWFVLDSDTGVAVALLPESSVGGV